MQCFNLNHAFPLSLHYLLLYIKNKWSNRMQLVPLFPGFFIFPPFISKWTFISTPWQNHASLIEIGKHYFPTSQAGS